jgi:hypothetical protein
VLLGYGFLVSSSAEKAASSFCKNIVPGSNIESVIAAANEQKISYVLHDWYVFQFPGAFFDAATCEVSVDKSGKVVSRGAHVQYD